MWMLLWIFGCLCMDAMDVYVWMFIYGCYGCLCVDVYDTDSVKYD